MPDLQPGNLNQETALMLQRIIEEADGNLAGLNPLPFSPAAFERLRSKIKEYAGQIIAESIKVSKRYQADAVSVSDVEQASRHLVAASSHKFYKHLGTFGGLACGAGLSNALAMVTTNQFNATGVILSVVLSAVGAFSVALHAAKE